MMHVFVNDITNVGIEERTEGITYVEGTTQKRRFELEVLKFF